MKELSIEQKAKAYDEAIKKAEVLYKTAEPMSGCNVLLETVFPELKESEDERIRKELIDFVKSRLAGFPDCKRFTDFLEKQGEHEHVIAPKFSIGDTIRNKITSEVFTITNRCVSLEYYSDISHSHEVTFSEQDDWELVEQKPADKVEPKFKVGDWVVDRNGTVQQILSYKDCIYKHTNGYSSKMFEDEWRMWNVAKDAKDGDVLATDDGNIFVFDGTVEETKYPFAYYGLTRRRFESYDRRLPFTHNNVHPATKEQRDLLFQKMKEAGYDWDSHTNKMIYNNDYRRLR